MGRPKPLLAVWLTVVIDLLGFGLVLPLLPLYAEKYRASAPVIGAIFASFSAMQFLFAPLWGRLSDRIGRRPVILLGLCGSTASYALFALAPSFAHPIPVLFASRALAGVFGGTISTAYAYIADVTKPEERGRGMALIGAAFGVGFTLGPAIGGLSWSEQHESVPGWIAAGFSACALVFALLRLPEPERRREAPRGWFDRAALRASLGTAGVPIIFALTFLCHACFGMFETTLALFGKERFGFTVRNNGWLFAYLGFWSALAQGFLVRRLMRPVGERRMAVLGTLVLGGGLVAVSQAATLGWMLVAVPLPVLGFSMLNPSLGSLLSRRTGAEVQGGTLGLNQSCASLARIAGPLCGYGLYAIGPAFPHWAGAAGMALGLVLALRLARIAAVDRS